MSPHAENLASIASMRGSTLSARLRTQAHAAPPTTEPSVETAQQSPGRPEYDWYTESPLWSIGRCTNTKEGSVIYAVELTGSAKGSLWTIAMPPARSGDYSVLRATEMCSAIYATIQTLLNEPPNTSADHPLWKS
jgi:hypothetical protein